MKISCCILYVLERSQVTFEMLSQNLTSEEGMHGIVENLLAGVEYDVNIPSDACAEMVARTGPS